MKTKFTKPYILSNRGCYEKEEVEQIKCINNKTITIKQLFRDLPIKDFTWFLVNKCDLTLTEKRFFALENAKFVLPIYEKQHPEGNRVKECIEANELYLEGKISLKKLRIKRHDAAAAADAATFAATYAAADAATYAADAAADAATCAADAVSAADAATFAAFAATFAADAAYATTLTADAVSAADAYKEFIWSYVEKLMK